MSAKRPAEIGLAYEGEAVVFATHKVDGVPLTRCDLTGAIVALAGMGIIVAGGLRYCALFDGTAPAFDVEGDKPFWQRKTTRSICRNGSG
jgi:hypothetical protein